MKITICGSMCFAKEMIDTQTQLTALGHDVVIPIDANVCRDNPELKLNESIEHCETFTDIDIDKDHFNKISAGDAILVLNYSKNGIQNYIGGATLMEIGVARYLDKKIYLLNDIPSEKDLRYAMEIRLAKPTILNNDLKKIPV